MKANELVFDNLIDVDPRSGMIKMNNRRMTLMSVEALGLLRRDLVDTLSMDRAKGFLMRYGWACGYRGAENIKQAYTWNSLRDLILAGPVLHTLEGVVTVEADKLVMDDDSLYFTGYWRNSFEVEEHLNHYGMNDSSVCWILVGYASGFLSNVFEKEVIVYEEKCIGKGDDYCYFVGETVDYNNPRHVEDLRYYQTESLISELDRSYNEIQKLNKNIMEAEEVEQQLTGLLLEGKKLTDIVEALSDILDKNILIERNEEIFECAYKNEQDVYFLENESALDAHVNDGKNIEYYHLNANGETLGNLVVISNEPSNQKETMIINRALNICTIQMFHQIQLTQSIWHRKEEFFCDLLSNNLDEQTLSRGSHIFNIDRKSLQRIVAFYIEPEEKREQVVELMHKKDRTLDIFLKGKYIIAIVPESYGNEGKTFANEAFSLIKEKFTSIKVIIGVGRKVDGLNGAKKSFKDASLISDFIQLAYPNDSRISYYEELEPVLIFLKGSDQEELIEFCDNLIGDLIEYDQESSSNLLITLKTYLDNNGNLQKTANDLHLSIAGLRYRIERIEGFCGEDLKSGTGVFKYQLAIGVYFARQIINKRNTLIKN